MKVLSGLLKWLFPPRCCFCRKLLRMDKTSPCPACRAVLPFVPPDQPPVTLFGAAACIAPLFYAGPARDALISLKFRGRFSAAEPLAGMMAETVVRHLPYVPDTVTWVPLSPKRLKERGYDQSQLLAQAMCERLGWPKPRCLLRKKVQRAVQSSLKSDQERRANAQGAYEATGLEWIRGKRVLLIDDICTSGATLSECAGVLLAAGAVSVTAVVAARREHQ